MPRPTSSTDDGLPERLRRKAAAFFHARQVGPQELTTTALVCAGLGSVLLLAGRAGSGALLGLAALAGTSLSAIRPPWPVRKPEFARTFAPLCDLLVLTSLVVDLARRHPAAVAVLALCVAVVMNWLPHLEAKRSGGARLWSRRDQLAVVLLGAMVGRPAPALAFVLLAAGAEAWLRLAPSRPAGNEHGWAKRVFLPNGGLRPTARWVSVVAVVAALFLAPATDLWRP